MLRSLFCLETALHVSGGNPTHYQERIQLYLQHLVLDTPLLLSAAIVEELELQFQFLHDSFWDFFGGGGIYSSLSPTPKSHVA
jgi:hypothetical protein